MAEKMWRISICMIMAFLLCACAGNTNMEKKVRDLDFTVVSTVDISEELKKHIDERKEESFTLIYRDGEEMYLIVGYGRQSGGGFSIRVNDLYLGENAVCVSTPWRARERTAELTEKQRRVQCHSRILFLKWKQWMLPSFLTYRRSFI